MKKFKLTHKFVEFMPESLDEGILYISPRFNIISHLCCCGCGNEVVLNLSPGEEGWKFTYDGKNLTVYPSIGNYNLKCQSHYFITNNVVEWIPKWDKKWGGKNTLRKYLTSGSNSF